MAPTDSEARLYLDGWSLDRALSAIAGVEGGWHPTGFMVFHTQSEFQGMPVRVHLWPRRLRPVEAGHPPIHRHMWPLWAKVLTGTYSEAKYEFDDADAATGVGTHHKYIVEYHSREDATISRATTDLVLVERVRAHYPTGSVHHATAEEWHETLIAPEDLVVTVMVTGRPGLAPALLAGGDLGTRTRRVRERVTAEQLRSVVKELTPM